MTMRFKRLVLKPDIVTVVKKAAIKKQSATSNKITHRHGNWREGIKGIKSHNGMDKGVVRKKANRNKKMKKFCGDPYGNNFLFLRIKIIIKRKSRHSRTTPI
jgi:2-hydroxy-3-keto-5-methylthiopentenyl-1-phosphate phosphatase